MFSQPPLTAATRCCLLQMEKLLLQVVGASVLRRVCLNVVQSTTRTLDALQKKTSDTLGALQQSTAETISAVSSSIAKVASLQVKSGASGFPEVELSSGE